MAPDELQGFPTEIRNLDRIGLKEAALLGFRPVGQELWDHRDLDIAGDGCVHRTPGVGETRTMPERRSGVTCEITRPRQLSAPGF